MLKCWEVDIDSRICFKEIVAELTREASETHMTEGFAKLSSNRLCNHYTYLVM